MRQKLIGAGFSLFGATRLHRLAGPGLRGLGAILMFHHVRPPHEQQFRPNGLLEIAPAFLEAVVIRLRKLGYDIVTMDDAVARIKEGGARPSLRGADLRRRLSRQCRTRAADPRETRGALHHVCRDRLCGSHGAAMVDGTRGGGPSRQERRHRNRKRDGQAACRHAAAEAGGLSRPSIPVCARARKSSCALSWTSFVRRPRSTGPGWCGSSAWIGRQLRA